MRQTMWRLRSVLRRFSSGKDEETIHSSKPITPISPSAAAKVLGTPELLEMILLHCTMQELLPLQRTSRHFRDIILSSAPLRRKLFLSEALHEDKNQQTDNPYLKERFPKLGTYLLQGNPKWRPKFIKALAEEDVLRLGPEFFRCETATWRNMLLTQPPVKEVVVYAGFEDGVKVSRNVEDLVNAQVSVKSAHGVTMGMIYDASAKANRKSKWSDVRRNDSGYGSIGSVEEDFQVEVVEIVV